MKWSISAHNIFRRCQRQYLFSQIIASPRAKDRLRREAYTLKQLQGFAAWQGAVVHNGISQFLVRQLKAGGELDTAAVIDSTLDMARQQFTFSRQQEYRTPGLTKKAAGIRYAALYGHEYSQEISEVQLQQVLDTIRNCFMNLLEQKSLLEEIRNHRDLYCEQTFPFALDTIMISPKLDLLFFNAMGHPVIIDWKVSADDTSDYFRQVMVYALSVTRKWPRIRPEDIVAKEVNLLKNTFTLHTITAGRLQDTEDFIYRSITAIRDLVGDHKWESQSLEDFEPARSFRSCQYCNFRKLCQEVYRDLPPLESIPDQESDGTQLRLPTF